MSSECAIVFGRIRLKNSNLGFTKWKFICKTWINLFITIFERFFIHQVPFDRHVSDEWTNERDRLDVRPSTTTSDDPYVSILLKTCCYSWFKHMFVSKCNRGRKNLTLVHAHRSLHLACLSADPLLFVWDQYLITSDVPKFHDELLPAVAAAMIITLRDFLLKCKTVRSFPFGLCPSIDCLHLRNRTSKVCFIIKPVWSSHGNYNRSSFDSFFLISRVESPSPTLVQWSIRQKVNETTNGDRCHWPSAIVFRTSMEQFQSWPCATCQQSTRTTLERTREEWQVNVPSPLRLQIEWPRPRSSALMLEQRLRDVNTSIHSYSASVREKCLGLSRKWVNERTMSEQCKRRSTICNEKSIVWSPFQSHRRSFNPFERQHPLNDTSFILAHAYDDTRSLRWNFSNESCRYTF